MLAQPSLLIHPWTRTTLADGEAWIRSIADAADRPLGFVRYQDVPALLWFLWPHKIRLDVYETEDASHVISVARSWTTLHIWDVQDAEDRHIGSVYPKSLVTSDQVILGYLDDDASGGCCIVDTNKRPLATFGRRVGAATEFSLAPAIDANPFRRMLLLAGVLALDPQPG